MLHSLYTIKRSRTGLGLFAQHPIPKGIRIVEYTGPYVPNKIVDLSNGKYFFGINSRWSIDGSVRDNIARYANHSCCPNAEAIIHGRRVWIWSKRRIEAGEEITYDYGREYFDNVIEPIGCRCSGCVRQFGPKSKVQGSKSKVKIRSEVSTGSGSDRVS